MIAIAITERHATDEARRECALCGADQPAQHTQHNGWCANRHGEWFCCRSHRDQSGRLLRDFLTDHTSPGGAA